MEHYDYEYAQEVGRALKRIDRENNPLHGCEYPGCYDLATIHCGTLGCTHFVCETHGNGAIEVAPEQYVAICWGCDCKGWGE